MKIYIGLWLILIALYAVFHFGFRTDGSTQLYRINDKIAFETRPDDDQSLGGVTIRGYRQTNSIISFACGACSAHYSEVDMPQANYIKGDWIYSGFPQHETAKTDLVNWRTGEAVDVDAPADFKFGDDLSKLAAYRERDLKAGEEYKLTQYFVKANFQPLSTFTTRCVWIHIAFAILALFLIFPPLFFWVMEVITRANDPNEPSNYYGNDN